MRTHPGQDRPPDYEEDRIVAISIIEWAGQTRATARLRAVTANALESDCQDSAQRNIT